MTRLISLPEIHVKPPQPTEGQPVGEERRRVVEKLSETILEGLTNAVDYLAGTTPRTLQDVTCCQRERMRHIIFQFHIMDS